ncbi:ArsR/SmtB family transcription factor [Arthrobacter rhizosphaerae]|uniref:ArsR/SmtB family transcription factor n=1 Tax=Arthrobacter rhizosphaerae TaxID=2855490 RepID=UPI001FF3E615|nr:metalloregulator ArsR/SmtB family transcription factor [Arthrobacter rhizosphaerae]
MLNNQQAEESGRAQLDSVFQALTDPTRRAIIVRLCQGPASVSELATPFAMSLPAIVQHLQVLENCGLIRTEKIGRVRSCSIVPGTLRFAENWLAARRTPAERRLDRLEAFLESDDPQTVTTGQQGTRQLGETNE